MRQTTYAKFFVVLDRLKSFLPVLKKANDDLVGEDPDSKNIEVVQEGDKFIEMVRISVLTSKLIL